MQSLTFGELKKALACCTVYKSCDNCPLFRGPDLGPVPDCTDKLLSAAFNCIRTLEADFIQVKDSQLGGNN